MPASRAGRIGQGLGVAVAVLVFATLACTESSGPETPEPHDSPLYGALVTPRGDIDVDPLFVDAYQALGVDGYGIGHFAISWKAIAVGPSSRDWRSFDPHVEQSIRREIGLSVVVEFIHGADGEVPSWAWPVFPGWENPELLSRLASFLREVAARSRGSIRYLWLGEGIDRYAAAYPGDEDRIVAFYAELADSLREILPDARLGTMVAPATLDATQGEGLVRGILEHLDLVGLSVPPEPTGGTAPPPSAALATLRQRIAPWEGSPFAILDAGYPSGSEFSASTAAQRDFASILAAWLWQRPSTLELFCWSPIHDAGPALADSLARRRYPAEPEDRQTMTMLLRSMGLRRIDGSPKEGRQVWVEERP